MLPVQQFNMMISPEHGWPLHGVMMKRATRRDDAHKWWLLLAVQDPFVPSIAVKNLLTFLLRFGNTFIGGDQWVRYAALIGLQ
jgi:hypothetical protein